jgi:hypothetical protein
MTDGRILTPDGVKAATLSWDVFSLADSHEALRSKLAESQRGESLALRARDAYCEERDQAAGEAAKWKRRCEMAESERVEIIARRDQVLSDLRAGWEAEIAARKLVEAKLTVAEAERDERTKERDAAQHEASTLKTFIDIEGQVARAERAEAALAERTKELDVLRAQVAGAATWRRTAERLESEKQAAEHALSIQVDRAVVDEADLARVRRALEGVLANHCLDCGAYSCHYCSASLPEWAHEEHCMGNNILD